MEAAFRRVHAQRTHFYESVSVWFWGSGLAQGRLACSLPQITPCRPPMLSVLYVYLSL